MTTRSMLVALVLFAAACGDSQPEAQEADDWQAQQPEPQPEPEPEPEPPPPPAITVTPVDNTPMPEGATPTLRILSPTKNQVVKNAPVKVRLQLRNWDTAEGGPHVHLIVDNEPYRAIFDPSQPIELTDLPEGVHYLRAFPSRQNHESVKTPRAFAWVRFFVGPRPADMETPASLGPLLTYSRPKGEYPAAEANPLMLDFYLTDVTLAPDGHRVHYWIDGANEGDITTWSPHHIANLTPGAHKVTLELRDAQNAPVPGQFNRTEREITIR